MLKNGRKSYKDGCLPFLTISSLVSVGDDPSPRSGRSIVSISLSPSRTVILYHFLQRQRQSLEPAVLLCILAGDQGQGCNCLPSAFNDTHKYTQSLSVYRPMIIDYLIDRSQWSVGPMPTDKTKLDTSELKPIMCLPLCTLH